MATAPIALPRLLTTTLLLAAALAAGCTTKMEQATDPYHQGDFAMAAEQADKVATTESANGEVTDLDVEHDKDRLWAGLEKAKILQDKGDFDTSLALYSWVDRISVDLRKMESWYAQNPANPATWDAASFMKDAGQAVVGADQTDYLLQPYEMILANSYMTLDAIMAGRKAGAYARKTLELQEWEKKDLKLVGEEVIQPDLSKIDDAAHGDQKSGIPKEFSFKSVFDQTGFGAAKTSMNQAIADARRSRSADPRVAFGYLMEWAAFVQAGDPASAASIRRELGSACGAKTLLATLPKYESNAAPDFVLVVIGAGKAPTRDYFSVRVPIPIPNVGTGYFRGVYPFLRFRSEGRPGQFGVTADGRRSAAEQVDSIDAIAARNFQRRELELWMIPTIRGVIRTIASIVGQKIARENDQGGIASIIAIANVAVAEAEQADLRIWSTLPAEHHAVLVPRPKDGKLRIDYSVGAARQEVEASVGPGSSLVYLRAISGTAISSAHAGVLRGPGSPAKDSSAPAPSSRVATATPATKAPSAASPAAAPEAAPKAGATKLMVVPAARRSTEDVGPGTGVAARSGDVVLYHYTCAVEGGATVFDSRGGTPRARVAGDTGKPPAGLDQALVGARAGMHRRLRISAREAYGDSGSLPRGVPADSTLVFDVYVERVKQN